VERQYNDGSNNEESTGMGMDNTSKYDGGQRKRKWIERRYGHQGTARNLTVERQYNDGSNNEESTGMGMDNTSKYDGGQRKRKWIERR